MSELYKIAEKILKNGKGILAADESTGTMKKRLDSISVESNEKNRLIFRETLFSSNSMKECIGGVILYDETIKQNTSQNKSIPELISESGAVPGIKVDTGAKTLAGSKDEKISNEEIAELTLKCLKESVPSEVPGIAFLSGGQTEIEATANLNQINIKNDTNFIMTYSYGRALQQSALKFWSKDINNIKGTQEVFDHRAKMCTLASQGKWSESLENSK